MIPQNYLTLGFEPLQPKVDFPPSLGDIPELAQLQTSTHSKDNETRMLRIPSSKSAKKSGELEDRQPNYIGIFALIKA
jgi:hypothetical protein